MSTALVAVLTSLAVSGINAAIRRFQARYGTPTENGAQGAPAKAPPQNSRRSGPVHPEEADDE